MYRLTRQAVCVVLRSTTSVWRVSDGLQRVTLVPCVWKQPVCDLCCFPLLLGRVWPRRRRQCGRRWRWEWTTVWSTAETWRPLSRRSAVRHRTATPRHKTPAPSRHASRAVSRAQTWRPEVTQSWLQPTWRRWRGGRCVWWVEGGVEKWRRDICRHWSLALWTRSAELTSPANVVVKYKHTSRHVVTFNIKYVDFATRAIWLSTLDIEFQVIYYAVQRSFCVICDAIYLSACPYVLYMFFTRKRKALEISTSTTHITRNLGTNFDVHSSKVKVTRSINRCPFVS